MPEDLVSVAQSLVPEILSNLDRIDEECQLAARTRATAWRSTASSPSTLPRNSAAPSCDPPHRLPRR